MRDEMVPVFRRSFLNMTIFEGANSKTKMRSFFGKTIFEGAI